jgi:TolA-binding protein
MPLFFLLVLLLPACVATTTDIDRLQKPVEHLQKGQADLMFKIEALDRSLVLLSEQLTQNQKEMALLSQKLETMELLAASTTQNRTPVPSEWFEMVYRDYLANKIPLALSGFKKFIEQYPESALVEDAQFYLADCYLIQKEFISARMAFDAVLARSRKWRAQALLKRAYALAGSKKMTDQTLTLKTLIQEFPQSPEAKTAKQILEEQKETSHLQSQKK